MRSADDRALVLRSRAGEADARSAAVTELTARYRPLVLARAARLHRRRGSRHDDVVSSGQVGLLKAIRDYDPDRGVPFAAYAEAKVVGEMMRWFRDSRYVAHVPRPTHERAMAVSAAERVLELELAGTPSEQQVAERCGLTVAEVREARGVRGAEQHRRDELAADPPAASTGDHDALITLRSALRILDPDDRRLLVARFWEEVPQRVIGEELGVSQAHVSRLERQAIRRLRDLVRGG